MRSKTILIVEDDVKIREALRLALEQEGYTVLVASNGKEGLDACRIMPSLGLIFLDLMMPVMDGFEFLAARKLDAKLSRIPVVIVSAFMDKMKELEAEGFLKKPFSLDDTFDLLNKYCPLKD